MPRKKYEPCEKDSKLVKAMVAYGIPYERIASVLGCSLTTLYKFYQKEIDTGAAEMVTQVANKLFDSAINKNNVAAQIFILKARGGWKERHDVTTNDETIQAGGVKINVSKETTIALIGLDALSDEEIDRRLEKAKRKKAAPQPDDAPEDED